MPWNGFDPMVHMDSPRTLKLIMKDAVRTRGLCAVMNELREVVSAQASSPHSIIETKAWRCAERVLNNTHEELNLFM